MRKKTNIKTTDSYPEYNLHAVRSGKGNDMQLKELVGK